jgi:hypothetical protein
VLNTQSDDSLEGRKHSPVCSFSGFLFTQLGMASPQYMEKPKTKRFLDELMSTYCR